METEKTLPYTFKTAFDTSITRHVDNTRKRHVLGKDSITEPSTKLRDVDIEIYEECLEEVKHLNHPVYLLVKPFPKKIHPELEIIHYGNAWYIVYPKEYLKPEINVATMLKVSRWLKRNNAVQIK